MTDLVVYEDASIDSADTVPVGLINPLTGEVHRADDPAQVAAWVGAIREFKATAIADAERVACELLNHHLDWAGKSSVEVEHDGRVWSIAGESASAAANALVVADPAALREDLDTLAARGEISEDVATRAVRAVIEYKPNQTVLKPLMARQDAVGDAVREHVISQPRDRKRPTVKRVR